MVFIMIDCELELCWARGLQSISEESTLPWSSDGRQLLPAASGLPRNEAAAAAAADRYGDSTVRAGLDLSELNEHGLRPSCARTANLLSVSPVSRWWELPRRGADAFSPCGAAVRKSALRGSAPSSSSSSSRCSAPEINPRGALRSSQILSYEVNRFPLKIPSTLCPSALIQRKSESHTCVQGAHATKACLTVIYYLNSFITN